MGTWRDYLAGRRSDIGVHSQHAFVAFDHEEDRGLHNGIGGELYRIEGLVLSHLGPLFIVGWLNKQNLTPAEPT